MNQEKLKNDIHLLYNKVEKQTDHIIEEASEITEKNKADLIRFQTKKLEKKWGKPHAGKETPEFYVKYCIKRRKRKDGSTWEGYYWELRRSYRIYDPKRDKMIIKKDTLKHLGPAKDSSDEEKARFEKIAEDFLKLKFGKEIRISIHDAVKYIEKEFKEKEI